MKSNMINVPVEFVIDALQSRYDDVKDLWGNDASEALWDQALQLVEECGLGSNITSPSIYVDNYLVNGDYQSKIDDMEYWLENTSQFDEINELQNSIDELDESDDQKGYQQSQLNTLIDDAWDEYCQDNALIYNDDFACLCF